MGLQGSHIFRCGMPPLSYNSSPPREYSSLAGRHSWRDWNIYTYIGVLDL
ncbi:hypothetical protein LguiA_017848 [Lonicera macranthoides]